jgi:hypothetical protein
MHEILGSHSNIAEVSKILDSAFQLIVYGGSSVGTSNYSGNILFFNNLVLKMLIVIQKLFLNVCTSFISNCCTKLHICALACFWPPVVAIIREL